MVKKQSKRTRKFVSKGGVGARLQKGTVTSKGSLKRKHRTSRNGDGAGDDGNKKSRLLEARALTVSPLKYTEEKAKKREDADFVSKKNLGDLDMSSFFETFSDGEEGGAEENISFGENNDEDGSPSDEDSEKKDVNARELSTKKRSKSQKVRVATDDDVRSSSSRNSDDSRSDEEDVEEAERRMKEEMGKLQEKDPEFHQFLKENEESLLSYGGVDDEQDYEMDLTNHKMKTSDSEQNESGDSHQGVRMTPELLKKLEKRVFKSHGIKALRKLASAFKSACRVADEDSGSQGKGQDFVIESSKVFDRVMVMSLTKVYGEFHYHLFQREPEGGDVKTTDNVMDVHFDANKPINPKFIERAERWESVKPIILTFLKSIIHILAEAKEPDLVVFVLKTLSNYIPFVTPFPKLAESMLKTLASLWSAPIDASEDYQVVRLHSFLRIRQLALTQPFPFVEECLKKLYLAYAQRARFATSSSVTSALPTLTFMGNCVVELYSLDYHSSYQHAFIYIRQLALHLRTATQKKTVDALATVYCWQFLHCLRLWVAVLTEACQTSDEDDCKGTVSNNGEEQLLRSLIFPLSQVILGTARLIPSTRYLPFRLHCVRLLQQLAAATEIFLPTTSILLDVFDLHELSQPPKKVDKSRIHSLALTLKLRADNPLRTMEEMEMCISEVFVLLNRELDLYQYSAGFPEFSVRISQRVKKVRVACLFS
mmetsp:Transcript_14933/g.24140  ORF Transcript_14933/g.24140 Transcript_14933/m.24140 type:complete len:711 (+) Transcript_14933:88-2220(+)